MTPAQRRIIHFVAAKHGLTFEEITSRARAHRISHPRQEAMWEMRREGKWSYPRIAAAFGVDHTTVIYSCRQHEQRRAEDLETWNQLGTRNIPGTLVDSSHKIQTVHRSSSANNGSLAA